MNDPTFCTVAIDSPVTALDRPFDYRIPDRMLGRVAPGSVVRVPLHGRRVRAYVVAVHDHPAVERPSVLSALVSHEPLFAATEIATARWTADRYVSTLGSVLHRFVPGRYSAPALPAGRGAPPPRSAGPAWLAPGRPLGAQARTVVITAAPSEELEVAAHVCGETAARGQTTLVIAARTDLARRVEADALVHADLRPAARAEGWARARDGGAWVVAGTRAALFAPLPDLGSVVVLGAHDRSLKDERHPRLHGLVVALRRARSAGAAFVACSPSPPLDMAGPRARDYHFHERARHARRLVHPEVVSPRGGPVTARLLEAVSEAVASGRDALVFTARRGLALRVRCEECGWYPRCPECGAGLALFGGARNVLRCRSCARSSAPRSTCPDCGGRRLGGIGWGSERIEAALVDAGLAAPVLRVDASTPLPKRRPAPAVIVGTQAAVAQIAERSLGAVVVSDLDRLLALPDFRAPERAFQTLQDLAPLLGEGRFVVQTREPEHHAVQGFARGSFRWFAQRELPRRRDAGYPPFGVLVRVELDPDDAPVLRGSLRGAGAELVGPLVRPDGTGAALVRGPSLEPLLPVLRAFAANHPHVRVDVDPVDML